MNYNKRCKADINEFKRDVQDIIDRKLFDPRDTFKDFDFDEAAKLGINEEFFNKMGVTSEQMKKACIIAKLNIYKKE